MAANAYSFVDVQATIAGPGGIVNLGNGAGVAEEGITITQNEDKNEMKIGADGGAMMTLRASKAGTITVRLLKTSPTNAVLQQMYLFQTLSSANWGQNTIVVSQIAAGEMISARTVAFKKQPEITYAKDANMNEWAFDCGQVDRILG